MKLLSNFSFSCSISVYYSPSLSLSLYFSASFFILFFVYTLMVWLDLGTHSLLYAVCCTMYNLHGTGTIRLLDIGCWMKLSQFVRLFTGMINMSVYSTLYIVQCTLQSVHYTLYQQKSCSL